MTGKSVVFFNRFYWPDHAATAQLLTDLAEYLTAREWSVTVVAAATRYAGTTTTLPARGDHNGVNIHRIGTPHGDRTKAAGNLAEYGSYTAGALNHQVRMRGHPVIVSMTDPPMLATALLPLARARRSPLVHWVQDIHPEVASRVGPVPGGIVHDGLRTLANFVLRNADLTVTIGPAMAAYLASNGAPADRLRIIPNWVDTDVVRPIPAAQNSLIPDLGMQAKFVVLYSGNAGRAHPLAAALTAMKLLRDREDIAFLFVGGGPGHTALRDAVAAEDLGNARFMEYLPRERIAESHSMASACIVTEAPEVAGLLYPSKSIGIMASARPLLFVGEEASEVARAVRRYDCGIVIPSGDGEALAHAIVELRADPERAARLGANGRSAAVAHFDTARCCAAWEAALTTIARA